MPDRTGTAVPLADALDASEPLAKLALRLRESAARFACIRGHLPGPLAEQTRPGPIDTDGWTLLADNAAVAAKLRQLVPLFQEQLARQQHAELPLRVRVRGR